MSFVPICPPFSSRASDAIAHLSRPEIEIIRDKYPIASLARLENGAQIGIKAMTCDGFVKEFVDALGPDVQSTPSEQALEVTHAWGLALGLRSDVLAPIDVWRCACSNRW